MTDLIWIGNTLYPRWIVFAVPLIVVFGICLLAFLASRPQRESHD